MPQRPAPEPDRRTDPKAWEAWGGRQRANDRRRWKRRERRDRLAYPTDGSPITAEHTASFIVSRPAPQPPLTVHVTLRLTFDVQDRESSGLSSYARALEDLPLSWKQRDWLSNAFTYGVGAGLSSVDHPEPDTQMVTELASFELDPPLEAAASDEDVERLRMLVGDAVKGATTTLFGAIVSQWHQSKYLEPRSATPEWYIVPVSGSGSMWGGYPTREAAETQYRQLDEPQGYRLVLARDDFTASRMRLASPIKPSCGTAILRLR
jgi:hypothetical protein